MGTTTKGIWFPDASTTLSPLHTNFATLASSVDAAIPFDKEVVKDFATTAARDAAISTPTNGQRCRVNNVPMQYLTAVSPFYGTGWYTDTPLSISQAFGTTAAFGTFNTDFGKARIVGGRLNRTIDSGAEVSVSTGFSQYVLCAFGAPAETFTAQISSCSYEASQTTGANDINFRVFARGGGYASPGTTFSFQFMAIGF